MTWCRAERQLVVLIALHSYAVGLGQIFLAGWALPFAGFPPTESLFFAHQGGAFHLVVATAYLVEYFRRGEITLILLAKSLATVFLVAETVLQPQVAWAVPFSAAGDASMALLAWWVHRKAVASRERVTP